MSLSRKVAESLCSSAELKLFDESTPSGVADLTNKQIESKIKLARNYKDKYTSLHRKQVREAQSKKGFVDASISGNTAKKAQIFDDCIRRFESTIMKREQAAMKPKKPLGRPPGSLNKKTLLAQGGKPSKKTLAKKKSAKKKG